ncbi:MAG: helix-turn-helix domain-containing protein [Candidatus Omnitrophota bacterium]
MAKSRRGGDEILTIADASRLLKLSKSTVYNLAQKKKIPAFKLGKSWRFVKAYLIRWIEEGARIR